MEQTPPQAQPPQQAGLHQSDADDDDENVKQLNECSSLYLSLQVFPSLFKLIVYSVYILNFLLKP
jgi:hypothetical protein